MFCFEIKSTIIQKGFQIFLHLVPFGWLACCCFCVAGSYHQIPNLCCEKEIEQEVNFNCD